MSILSMIGIGVCDACLVAIAAVGIAFFGFWAKYNLEELTHFFGHHGAA